MKNQCITVTVVITSVLAAQHISLLYVFFLSPSELLVAMKRKLILTLSYYYGETRSLSRGVKHYVCEPYQVFLTLYKFSQFI